MPDVRSPLVSRSRWATVAQAIVGRLELLLDHSRSSSYWCAELLRFGFRAYGTGEFVVILWYWKSGHIREVETFACEKVSFSAFRDILNERGWDMLTRANQPVAKARGSQKAEDAAFQKKWPTLFDHLTQTTWDDGTARQTSTLLIFAADGMLKALLKDREAVMTLWASAATLETLLGTLERAARDPDAEWRADRQEGGGGTARRQKRS